jgi:septal ring factor EnvC (AmiA/AmiB activator)
VTLWTLLWGLLVLAVPPPIPVEQPNPLLQAVISGGVFAAIVTAVGTVLGIFLNKRLRSPSDQLAQAQFAVQLYKDQADEARTQIKLNAETMATLRDTVSKFEAANLGKEETIRGLYGTIRDLEQRNYDLARRIDIYQQLIDHAAQKLAAGQLVTVGDIAPGIGLEDLD